MDNNIKETLKKLKFIDEEILFLEERYPAFEVASASRVCGNISALLNAGLSKTDIADVISTNANFLFYLPEELSKIISNAPDVISLLKNL